MFKAIETQSITRHRNEMMIPKLRKTIAAVSWRRKEERSKNEMESKGLRTWWRSLMLSTAANWSLTGVGTKGKERHVAAVG